MRRASPRTAPPVDLRGALCTTCVLNPPRRALGRRTATCASPTRPTRAPGSWPKRGRRTAPCVTATEQSAGRGRQGRSWTAPPGKALLYSAILRPLDERHLLLPLAVPIAVCEAAESLRPGIECTIKWPNDVWLEERKLAGVLIEARPRTAGR